MTQGKYALVDDEDYEWLSQWNWWFNGGYATRVETKRGIRNRIFMHRLINDTPPDKYTDHINGNRLDNRRANLRVCTTQENARNMRKTHGSSVYKGVQWSHRQKAWKTTLNEKGQVAYIGYFKNERHAALAYDLWAIDMWGQFAKVNLPVLAKNHPIPVEPGEVVTFE